MDIQPVNLYLADERTLAIEWSDGRRRKYPVAELRRQCPCAMCAAERRRLADGGEPAAEPPAVGITEMTPVGNYAYKIRFSDGHDTGLYSLHLLRELGRDA